MRGLISRASKLDLLPRTHSLICPLAVWSDLGWVMGDQTLIVLIVRVHGMRTLHCLRSMNHPTTVIVLHVGILLRTSLGSTRMSDLLLTSCSWEGRELICGEIHAWGWAWGY